MSENVKAYSDFFIKYLFASKGNEGLVLDFINDVLEDSDFPKIETVEIMNPFSIRSFLDDKMIIVDLEVKDETGKTYNIEVQSYGNKNYKHRSLYYWAKIYSDQISKGDHYTKLKAVITINLLNFNLIDQSTDYHNWFLLTHNKDKDLVLTDHLIMHFLELPKIFKDTPKKDNTGLSRWLYFFKYRDKEDIDMKLVIKDDDKLKEANDKYEYFTKDDELRKVYDAFIKKEMEYRTDLEIAEETGREKGIQEGIQRDKLETAKKMKEKNADIDFIVDVTGLSKEDIDKL